jgi:hypothetical protein
MAELISSASSPNCVFGTKAGNNNCKSEPSHDYAGTSSLIPYAATTSTGFHLGSVVYVRYKDHVLYKNIQQPIKEAVERETIGWFSKQTDEIMLIEHDRTIPNDQIPKGQGSGVIILKSCILEMYELPLQNNPKWLLNSSTDKSKSEFALLPKKRKTHGAKDSRRKEKL